MSALPIVTEAEAWPAAVPIKSLNGIQHYLTPEGPLPRVTSILKVCGLGTEGLIAWSAREEKKAILEACATVIAEDEFEDGPRGFVTAVEAKIGAARQHQKLLARGAEIGSSVHEMIRRTLSLELGLEVGPEPKLSDPALVAYMSFEDWWKASRLKPLRIEQPVWSVEGYAGTVDLIASHPERGVGIIDFKSSKGLYDTHHLQVAAYCHAARNWSEISWAELVRLPKSLDDPEFEVKPLGSLYDRTVSEEGLLAAFRGLLAAWQVLCRRGSQHLDFDKEAP